MTNIDQQLKSALRDHPLDHPGIIEMAASNFQGRQRNFSILTVIVGLAMMAIMVWCGVRFFAATEVRQMILFATLFLVVTGGLMMLKLWFWLLMIRYSVARELKRMELQLSDFAAHAK